MCARIAHRHDERESFGIYNYIMSVLQLCWGGSDTHNNIIMHFKIGMKEGGGKD